MTLMSAMIAMPSPGGGRSAPAAAPAAATPTSSFAGVLSSVSSGNAETPADLDADTGDDKAAAYSEPAGPRPPGRRRDAADKEASRQAKTGPTADPAPILALAQAAIQPAPATGALAKTTTGLRDGAPGSIDGKDATGTQNSRQLGPPVTADASAILALAQAAIQPVAATITAAPAAAAPAAPVPTAPVPAAAPTAPASAAAVPTAAVPAITAPVAPPPAAASAAPVPPLPATPGAAKAVAAEGAAAQDPVSDTPAAPAPVAAPNPSMVVSAATITAPLAKASDRGAASGASPPVAGAPVEAATAAAPVAKPGSDPSPGDRESGGQQDRRGAAPTAAPMTVNAVITSASDATPTSQVLDVLQTLVADATSGSTSGSDPTTGAVAAAAVAVEAAGAATPAAAKGGVVTVELNPANLGRVTITVSLRSTTLDVHISVDNKDTLSVLSADKAVLSSALGSHGNLDLTYTPAAPTVDTARDAPADRRTGGDGQAAADAQSGRGRRDGDPRADPSTSKVTSNESSAATAVRHDDGLYL